jgi:predicted nucleic acid-binding protein
MGWQEKATRDEAQIRLWWAENPRYNIGIKTGDQGAGRSFLLIVDYDAKMGKLGLQSLDQMDMVDLIPRTLKSGTPTDGVHLFYDVPRDCGLTTSADRGPDKAGRVEGYPDVDVRCEGGLAVAPGSTIDGRAYVFLDDFAVAAAPAALIELLKTAKRSRAKVDSREPSVDLDQPAMIERAIHYLKFEAGSAIEGSGGDPATYVVICRVKDLGISADLALLLIDEHWNSDTERVVPTWSIDDLAAKVRSAYKCGQLPPGAASPEAAFERVPPSSKVLRGKLSDFGQRKAFVPANDLVRDTVPSVGVGFLGGQSGALKTFVAIKFCFCVALGALFAGRKVETPGAVLYVPFEGRGTIPGRVEAQRSRLSDPDVDLPFLMLGEFGTLSADGDREAFSKVLSEVAEYAKERWGVPLRAVVIDTVVASGLIPEDKENDPAAWQKVFDYFQLIAERLQIAIILVHHYGKTAAAGLRGSSNARAGADFILAATCDRNELTGETANHFLALPKARNGPEGPIGAIRKEAVEIGKREDGSIVTSLVLDFDLGERRAAGKKRTLNKAAAAFVVAATRAIDEHGEDILIDGVKVRAARKTVFRDLYAESYAGRGDERSKSADNLRKQFNRAWGEAPDGWAVFEHGGDEWVREAESEAEFDAGREEAA